MSSSKATWFTLVALSEAALPDPEVVLFSLAQEGGREVPRLASRSEGMATFSWDDVTIAYTRIPRPIPTSQTEGPCSTAWYWPQAAAVLKNHQAHLLVTMVDEGRDAIDKALRLTEFVSALVTVTSPRAVLWAPAGLVHEPSAFLEQARQSTRENLPLFLWIGFRIESLSAARLRLFTTGLEAFDCKELEIEAEEVDPQQLLSDLYNVAHYHLREASNIKEADTVGLADGRQLRAHHQESMLGDGHRVIRLEYEARQG
jgi:hypothetical protein